MHQEEDEEDSQEESLFATTTTTTTTTTTRATRVTLEMMTRDVDEVSRTLDEFLEDAYRGHSLQDPHQHQLVTPVAASVCSFLGSMIQKWQYWLIMLSLGITNSSDASEILCLSYILSNDEFQSTMIHNDHDNIHQDDDISPSSSWKAGLLASAVFLGMLLGGLLVGTWGDVYGRHPMLRVGLICNSIAGILSACTTTIWQLSLLRCVSGFGIGATVPPLFTLVTELSPPSQRGLFVTFCASFWMVGSLFVASTAWILLEHWRLSWRVFAIACAIPSAVGAIMVQLFVPESPRFLAIRHQPQYALRIINSLALQMKFQGDLYTSHEIMNQYYPNDDDEELPEQGESLPSPLTWWHETNHTTNRGSISTMILWPCLVLCQGLADFWSSTSKVYSPQLLQTTWPLQTIWFSLNFGSYGILTWINTIFVAIHLENMYFNAFLFAGANLPGNILTAILMDRMGRTCMLMTSSLAAAISLLSFAYFASHSITMAEQASTTVTTSTASGTSTTAMGVVLSACCFQAFTIAAWNTIDCMTSERFPTDVRSTGMGVCAASGRIGAMMAQIINGAVLVGNPVRLLLVASISLIMAALTPLWLPKLITNSSGASLGTSLGDGGDSTSTRALEDTLNVVNESKKGNGKRYYDDHPPMTSTRSTIATNVVHHHQHNHATPTKEERVRLNTTTMPFGIANASLGKSGTAIQQTSYVI